MNPVSPVTLVTSVTPVTSVKKISLIYFILFFMSNQFESIRRLKERGMSIREIADHLSITKYEVEKALQQLKALENRPDSYPDDCLDDESDSESDTVQTVSRQPNYMSAPEPASVSPRNLPSEWSNSVTRAEADFIINYHTSGYEPSEIKALYEDEHISGYLSLIDIRKVIKVYEHDESQRKATAEVAKRAADEQTSRLFTNLVSEDALAFLLWVNDVDDWELPEMKSCIARAGTILSDIESFCRSRKLEHRHYEPYSIIESIKNVMTTSARRNEEPEFTDAVYSFSEMLVHRPSLDRYFWKMLANTKTSRW